MYTAVVSSGVNLYWKCLEEMNRVVIEIGWNIARLSRHRKCALKGEREK